MGIVMMFATQMNSKLLLKYEKSTHPRQNVSYHTEMIRRMQFNANLKIK